MSDVGPAPRNSIRRDAQRLLFVALLATACGDDEPDDPTGAGSAETTCTSVACGGSTSAASTGTDPDGTDGTSGAETATTLDEGSTMPADGGSSSGGDQCVTDTCAACFQCSYDRGCFDEQSACSVDAGCSVALICVRDCIEQSPDPTSCVGACDCPADGPFAALLACATAACVPNGSCPALSC